MKTAAPAFFAALAAAALLAGCGGDHLSWCYGSEHVQAGYNSSCRGGDAGTKDGEETPQPGN